MKEEVDRSKKMHILWPIKNYAKAGAYLVLHKIVVQSTGGYIVLYHQIKICKGWVARVKLLHETNSKKAHLAKSLA